MRRRALEGKVRELIRGQAVEVTEGLLRGFCFSLCALGSQGILGSREGHVTRYDLCFLEITLAVTLNSRVARMEAGRQGAFTIVEERDGASVDRSSIGH